MYQNIIDILKNNNIEYQEIDHEVSESCEDSKNLRAEAGLEWLGSKNIVFHCKWNFYIVVTHADKRINAKRFKKEFWSKDIRFANQDEITAQIDGTIWCIPSFGYKNIMIPLYIDSEIFEHEYFMFNPDDPTKTIRIRSWDLNHIYTTLENPVKYFLGWEETMEIIEEDV